MGHKARTADRWTQRQSGASDSDKLNVKMASHWAEKERAAEEEIVLKSFYVAASRRIVVAFLCRISFGGSFSRATFLVSDLVLDVFGRANLGAFVSSVDFVCFISLLPTTASSDANAHELGERARNGSGKQHETNEMGEKKAQPATK